MNLGDGCESLFFCVFESAPNIQKTEKSLRKTTDLSQPKHRLLLNQTCVCSPNAQESQSTDTGLW